MSAYRELILNASLRKTRRKKQGEVMKGALSILYNCSLQSSNTIYFKDHTVVDGLSNFEQNAQVEENGIDESLASMTKLILAHVLVDENDKSTSSGGKPADDKTITFVVKSLEEAANSGFDLRTKLGFSAHCLMFGIVKLAANDENSEKIWTKAKESLFKVLTKGITNDRISEMASAARAIWALAFVEKNKEDIRKTRKIMKRLELSAAISKNRRLKEASTGALWVLKHAKPQKDWMYFMNVEENTGRDHVMISYSWAQQPIVLKVKSALQSFGFRVWIDVEQMQGSVLQAMAEAVEDAAVVLVCMSQNYQDSPNCRVEGECAHQWRKDVIPLLVEEKFKPTGWLGALLGTKLYHDITKRQHFNEQVGRLAKELGERGKMSYVGRHAQTKKWPGTSAGDADRILLKRTCDNDHSWAPQNNLDEDLFKDFCGESLVCLKKLMSEAPEFFYRHMSKKFRLTNVQALMSFSNALENLPQPSKQAESIKASSRTSSTISTTTIDSLKDWAKGKSCEFAICNSLNEQVLAFLVRLRIEALEYFYSHLRDINKISNIQDLSSFGKALESGPAQTEATDSKAEEIKKLNTFGLSLNGENVKFLQALKTNAPEFFFLLVSENLERKDSENLMQFCKELVKIKASCCGSWAYLCGMQHTTSFSTTKSCILSVMTSYLKHFYNFVISTLEYKEWPRA